MYFDLNTYSASFERPVTMNYIDAIRTIRNMFNVSMADAKKIVDLCRVADAVGAPVDVHKMFASVANVMKAQASIAEKWRIQ